MRTLHAAIIPPGAMHVNGIFSLGSTAAWPAPGIAVQAALFASIPLDFLAKTAGGSALSEVFMGQFPTMAEHPLIDMLSLRSMRLNCITNEYSELWAQEFKESWANDSWADSKQYKSRMELGGVSSCWSRDVPVRVARDRRQLLVEIDALAAIVFGLTSEELCTIYRTQFPVLQAYERNDLFDANGRKVPGEVKRLFGQYGESLGETHRTATTEFGTTYTYEFPFVGFDREADMRQAHAHFTKVMEETN
jgi:hypothetical protein